MNFIFHISGEDQQNVEKHDDMEHANPTDVGNEDSNVSYDGLEEGFENLGFTIQDGVILRLLTICRENDIKEKKVVIDYAQYMANGSIDNTFVDLFEDR